MSQIKVIDLFAGPGGLSEGFSSVTKRGGKAYSVVLSIEKDIDARETLKLRTFFRLFPRKMPDEYYMFLRGEIELDELYSKYPNQSKMAEKRAWLHELSEEDEKTGEVYSKIKEATGDDHNFVLIGGPPCQAYSLAGRSRNAGNPEYDKENDVRQVLYVEYLKILADHSPYVFVMENVKGILSAKYKEERIFGRILNDLRNPYKALEREGRKTLGKDHTRYQIYSLITGKLVEDDDPYAAVIRAEKFGIPQTRHRVILLGIRKDLGEIAPKKLKMGEKEIPVSSVLNGLPHLRSGLSKEADSADHWVDVLKSQIGSSWVQARIDRIDGQDLSDHLMKTLSYISAPKHDLGHEFIESEVTSEYETNWYLDSKLGGICNHSSRKHIRYDLFRYFFASCYGEKFGSSPNLSNFPSELLPKHSNVKKAIKEGGNFSDRFRVQIANKPATTIVSHIGKDGHYYIHPDPKQCRSFTVREAARVQTFPDNYYFWGVKTSQYQQVGNAVPPLLARQIAYVVLDIFRQAESKESLRIPESEATSEVLE